MPKAARHRSRITPVGWLVTTVTLFDALEKDIQRAFPNIHKAVNTACKIRFADSPVHQEVAKTVAILQILGNLPVTRNNVAGLIHASVDAANRAAAVNQAIEDLISDPIVPFGEQEGMLCFFSEKLNDIEQERTQISLRQNELRRIESKALSELYSPLPSAQLHNSLPVQTGLKMQNPSGSPSALAGERNPIQTVVELVDPNDYEASRIRLIDESRQNTAKTQIFLVGRTTPEMDDLTADIYRCREIATKYRNEPDQEVREYCNGQLDRANRLSADLERTIKRALLQGSFIFRGKAPPSRASETELLDAARKHLGGVAEQVFDRYGEAAARVNTDLAERFLLTGNLAGITAQLDPLGLVQSARRKAVDPERSQGIAEHP